ncbi:hypothetical protein JL722_12481 [Aureococcus anophagefferens]|nr:hypothetical protein JL722_12481 [Aureococcus anophagefferens]
MGLFESKPAPSASGAQDDRNDVDDGGAQDDRNDVADGGAQDGFGCDLAGKRFASAHQAACYRRSAAAAATRRERRGGGARRRAAASPPPPGAFHASAGPRLALAGAAPGAAKRALDASPGDFLATRLVQRVLCATDGAPALATTAPSLVETIAPLVRSLPRGAPVVLTLKFGGKGHEAASEARKLTHAAGSADLGDVAPFSPDFRLEWLVSNTKRERTLIAFRA